MLPPDNCHLPVRWTSIETPSAARDSASSASAAGQQWSGREVEDSGLDPLSGVGK